MNRLAAETRATMPSARIAEISRTRVYHQHRPGCSRRACTLISLEQNAAFNSPNFSGPPCARNDSLGTANRTAVRIAIAVLHCPIGVGNIADRDGMACTKNPWRVGTKPVNLVVVLVNSIGRNDGVVWFPELSEGSKAKATARDVSSQETADTLRLA